MPIADLSQPQRETLVRLLIGATYGDGHISLIESETFDSMIDSLRWNSINGKQLFIDEATSEARAAFESGSAEEFLVTHCKAFADPVTRATALDLIQHLLESDGLTLSEGNLLRIAMRELGAEG